MEIFVTSDISFSVLYVFPKATFPFDWLMFDTVGCDCSPNRLPFTCILFASQGYHTEDKTWPTRGVARNKWAGQSPICRHVHNDFHFFSIRRCQRSTGMSSSSLKETWQVCLDVAVTSAHGIGRCSCQLECITHSSGCFQLADSSTVVWWWSKWKKHAGSLDEMRENFVFSFRFGGIPNSSACRSRWKSLGAKWREHTRSSFHGFLPASPSQKWIHFLWKLEYCGTTK